MKWKSASSTSSFHHRKLHSVYFIFAFFYSEVFVKCNIDVNSLLTVLLAFCA